MVLNSSIAPCIRGLFRTCRPVAICPTVRAIVIAAFHGMFGRWSRPHIGIEGFKGRPLHHNASPTIIMIGIIARICAPIFHCIEDKILRGSTFAVRQFQACNAFTLCTFTTDGPSLTQQAALDRFPCPTVADDPPAYNPMRAIRRTSLNQQPTKPLPRQINVVRWRHDTISLKIVSDPSMKDVAAREGQAIQKPLSRPRWKSPSHTQSIA